MSNKNLDLALISLRSAMAHLNRECVERSGVAFHEAWFGAADLGRAAQEQSALDDYAQCVLGSAIGAHKRGATL